MIAFDEAVEVVSRKLGYSPKLAGEALLEAMGLGLIRTVTSTVSHTGENELVVTTGLPPVRKQPIHIEDLAEFIESRQSLSIPVGSNVTRHKLKSRKHELDSVIQSAKKIASDPDDYHSVWTALKELALSGTPPFTGGVNEKTLEYTNSKNEVVHFSKDALRKRLVPSAR
jgi:hypothetical protein